MSRLESRFALIVVAGLMMGAGAASAADSVLEAPPGHRWVAGAENNIIAILIGLQSPGDRKIGGVLPHEPDPIAIRISREGRTAARYRCTCADAGQATPCEVKIDPLGRRATCTGNGRWVAETGPEPGRPGPRDGPAALGRRAGQGESIRPFTVAPSGANEPSSSNAVQATPQSPQAKAPALPMQQRAEQPQATPPTRPGVRWVDGHWQRERAE